MLPEILVRSHGNTEMKGSLASLVLPLSHSVSLSVLGLTGLLEIASVCLGCLSVAPICSDYVHTEWTWCCTGWLSFTNVLWHAPPPSSHFVFRAFSLFLLLEPTESVYHLISWTNVQLAIYLWSLRGLLDRWVNYHMCGWWIQTP